MGVVGKILTAKAIIGYVANLADLGVTASAAELNYSTNVTSDIQAQINGKQPLDTQLTSIAGLSYAGNTLKVVRVNAGETDFELATFAGGGDMLGANNLSDVSNAATSRTNLGLGTGNSPEFTSINLGHASNTTLSQKSAGVAQIEANELYMQNGTDVAVADGGTGSSTAAGALTNLGAEAITTIARGTGATVAINSVSVVNMASCTNTIAAGDTFAFQCNGYILNNSGGARTYAMRVTIGATTFTLSFSGTIAASATNVAYVQAYAEVAVISSSEIVFTARMRNGVGAAVGTAQNNVLAQDRSVVRTSTNNETGSKTVAIGFYSDSATATQTFTRTRAEISKGASI